MRCTLSIVVAMAACALTAPLLHDQSRKNTPTFVNARRDFQYRGEHLLTSLTYLPRPDALVNRDLDDDSAVLYRWNAAVASEDPVLETEEAASTETARGVQIEPRIAGALPDDDNAILYRWNDIEAVEDTTQVE